MQEIIIIALKQTLIMVLTSTIFSVILGFVPAILLTITSDDGLKPNKFMYSILDFIVNTLRSFPFVILMVIIMPLTKLLVGKSTGTLAAIVPLTIAAAPLVSRIIESALREVDKGVIEAAKSFGASNFQIIFKVMLKEAIPSIVSGITLALISIVGYSAMAGTLGAGGLGDVAIRYGYQRFETDFMIVTCIILIVFVQFLQFLGNCFYGKLSK
ncbi:ABC transporter permease [Clostridium botulinum]|uniref:D-methionine transport system permease protein MetI n=2 Tax=Clostridium TaxID=1485 RepID=B2TL96_CLOBB|nr:MULTISPECIES: methionine ABC transporter permease [Clostridium]ACD23555.1 D-methionine transport system permease protein MetI [Clostridium botulinum B str. Eklund 17B (NRP)]MBN1044408.1 ABC transporter permease [Clostridium botulinum]MBN1051076.1 ABC transporter permease [Clostridium botulinum]MBN1054366.1 ABC transporter permease [Clostridium botulinum]MBY6976613.1 ABC transporter permease [Clostridium botulinum]